MDQDALRVLARLLRTRRVAALGTLHDGKPFVSMVLTVASPDGSAFYFLASGLAWHTRDIVKDPRVGLMLMEEESPERDPQALARLSITGEVTALDPGDIAYAEAGKLYLSAFPSAERYFQLGDFVLYQIQSTGGRFVGGFARAFTISPEDLKQAARL